MNLERLAGSAAAEEGGDKVEKDGVDEDDEDDDEDDPPRRVPLAPRRPEEDVPLVLPIAVRVRREHRRRGWGEGKYYFSHIYTLELCGM